MKSVKVACNGHLFLRGMGLIRYWIYGVQSIDLLKIDRYKNPKQRYYSRTCRQSQAIQLQ